MARAQSVLRVTPPPARSPERERLAGAIERHQSAVVRLQQLEGAKETALKAIFAAMDARDAAQEQLEKAQAAEQHHLVDRLLEQTDEAADDPVSVAMQALESARYRYDQTKRAETALREETERAESGVRWARNDLSEAVNAVVRASVEVRALLAEYDAALLRLDSLRLAIEEVGILALPAEEQNWHANNRIEYRKLPRDPRPADAWRASIDALQTDADAELPT